MKVTLPFGEGFLTEELPDTVKLYSSTWTPTNLKAVPDLQEAIQNALDHPLEAAPIEACVSSRSRVVIAFDDPTVMSFAPVRKLAVKEILCRLEKKGVRKENILLICATGIHRRFNRQEIASILGEDVVKAFGHQVFSHDAEDPKNLTFLGRTSEGYEVEINRFVCESDLTIYINASSLRGLTGGWKSICVGLSTYRSLRWSHTPDGLSAKIENNPLHRMLNEMGKLLEQKIGREKIFKIETITKNPFEVAHVFAGNIWKTREKALEVLKSQPRAKLPEQEKADILIYGVPAFSPYAVFSRMNPILTLFSTGLGYLGGEIERIGKKGCSVIMATPCPNEWDRRHHAAYPRAWEILQQEEDPYRIQQEYEPELARNEEFIWRYRFEESFHPVHGLWAAHPRRKMRHVNRIYVAGAQDPGLIRSVGLFPTRTIAEALAQAREFHGKDARVVLIQHKLF